MVAKSPIIFQTEAGHTVAFRGKKAKRSPAKSLKDLNKRLAKAFPSQKQAKMRSRAREKWLSARK